MFRWLRNVVSAVFKFTRPSWSCWSQFTVGVPPCPCRKCGFSTAGRWNRIEPLCFACASERMDSKGGR